ncbi:MAG TPA: DUF1302 domain-containing protein [Solimonas sp.]
MKIRLGTVMLGGVASAVLAGPVQAYDFSFGGADIKLNNLITVGAMMRMQDRDLSLIGKSNATPGLCVRRTSPDGDPNLSFRGDTCTTGDGGVGNQRALDAPGTFSVNGDNGNLNFDRHDIVHATAKLTTDLSVNWGDTLLFVRGLYYFDDRYQNQNDRHPDTTLQASRSAFSRAGKKTIGSDLRLLDYFLSHNFEFAERQLNFKIGNQVLNWGESSFLALNSLSAINPPNAALLRLPGFDIKELFEPVGMAVLNAEIAQGLSAQLFYQYEWRPVVIDPVGSFFSTTDFVGDGGTYAMLSLGKAPEDPEGLYRPVDNPDDPAAALGSTSSRTLRRLADREPEDGGQYGASLKWFAERLNGGTDFAFYFANYHSRVPSASLNAAQATCVPADTGNPATNALALIAACGISPTNLVATQTGGPYLPAAREALPLDTASVFVEYPEDVRLYGVSFNTTIGDFALSGEYAFRENLPVQIHPIDLVLAALQPALPESDYSLGVAVVPGRRSATPDFVQTNYRGVAPTPGMYIQGFERMKVGQAGMTLIRIFGGTNPLGASQIFTVFEAGLTHVLDFPDLTELQFAGGVADQHISNGGDGVAGINPRDVRTDPNDPTTNRSDPELRQNPTPQDRSSFGTEYSWGYRAVMLTRYDNLFLGANIEFLTALFHDVQGVSPGLGMNFIEGRKQILAGVRWDYQSTWLGEVRYTIFTGGAKRDALRDRDNLMLWLGYQF